MPDMPPTGASSPSGGTIVVTGTGRVAVVPDLAELRLGVSIARPTVDGARADAAARMEAILAALDEAGVERRDVRTSLLSVQPRWDYRDGQAPVLIGYELSNAVQVTIRELTRLADIVDGALKAGATSMDGLDLRVADPASAEREARMAAVAAARARADVLAAAAGVTIVSVADIVEGDVPTPPGPLPKATRMMLAADAAMPVEAGSTEVAVTVSVTYRIGRGG